jgi:hypothetical protein
MNPVVTLHKRVAQVVNGIALEPGERAIVKVEVIRVAQMMPRAVL